MIKDDVISAGTSIGAVTLKVADVNAMTAFYRDGIGLAVQAQGGERTILDRVWDRVPSRWSSSSTRRC